MKTIFFISVIIIKVLSISAQEVRMRNWEFEWIVLDAYDRELRIIKNEDLLIGKLISSSNYSYDSVDFFPEDASYIAEALWKTQEELDILKNEYEQTRIEVRKKISLNEQLQAVYLFDENGGRVYLSEPDPYSLDLYFQPEVAEMIAKILDKSDLYFKAVDDVVSDKLYFFLQ